MIFNGLNATMRKGDSDSIEVTGLSLVYGEKLYFTVIDHAYTTERKLSKIVTEFTAEGNAVIGIEPKDTMNLQPRNYVYDIQALFSNGEKLTIIPPSPDLPPPKFTLTAEVTYE